MDERWVWWRRLVARPLMWSAGWAVDAIRWQAVTIIDRLGGPTSPWLWTWAAAIWLALTVAAWGNRVENRQALFRGGEDVAAFGSGRTSWLGPVRTWIRAETVTRATVAMVAEVGGYVAAFVLFVTVAFGPIIAAAATLAIAGRRWLR